MKEDRKASVSTVDTQYQMKVDSKIRRQEMEQNRFVDEQARRERTPQTQENVIEELVENRYDVSPPALSTLLLQTVAAGGGNIDCLPLSRGQVEHSSK